MLAIIPTHLSSSLLRLSIVAQPSKENSHLPNILIPHPTNLLNIRRALAHPLQTIPRQHQLILHILARLHINPRLHSDSPDNLLPQEIANLDLIHARVAILLDVHVDGEMRVHVAHLVLEAPGHADDEVLDDGFHRADGGDVLAGAVVQFDG
jgi:hypothetical protein